jgi:hypothetical protein
MIHSSSSSEVVRDKARKTKVLDKEQRFSVPIGKVPGIPFG